MRVSVQVEACARGAYHVHSKCGEIALFSGCQSSSFYPDLPLKYSSLSLTGSTRSCGLTTMFRRAVEDISTGSDSDYSRCAKWSLVQCCRFGANDDAQLGMLFSGYMDAVLMLGLQWISWFLSSKGNEYFCEVDEDFILDRFNLTGLNNEVANYPQALDLITDNLGASLP